MSTDDCRCGRPTRDHAYACESCGDLLARALGDVPWLDEQMEVTITRQQGIDYRRLGHSKGGKKDAERPLPGNWTASEARTHLRALLVSWVLFAHQEDVRNSAPCSCDNESGPNQGAETPSPGPDHQSAIPERG